MLQRPEPMSRSKALFFSTWDTTKVCMVSWKDSIDGNIWIEKKTIQLNFLFQNNYLTNTSVWDGFIHGGTGNIILVEHPIGDECSFGEVGLTIGSLADPNFYSYFVFYCRYSLMCKEQEAVEQMTQGSRPYNINKLKGQWHLGQNHIYCTGSMQIQKSNSNFKLAKDLEDTCKINVWHFRTEDNQPQAASPSKEAKHLMENKRLKTEADNSKWRRRKFKILNSSAYYSQRKICNRPNKWQGLWFSKFRSQETIR